MKSHIVWIVIHLKSPRHGEQSPKLKRCRTEIEVWGKMGGAHKYNPFLPLSNLLPPPLNFHPKLLKQTREVMYESLEPLLCGRMGRSERFVVSCTVSCIRHAGE